MIQLVYVSTGRSPFADDALRALLAHARARNTQRDVTGMLLHQAGAFMQVLEGEVDIVDPLFAQIGRDPRHRHVVMLARTELETRNFGDWSMGFVDVRGTATRLPGFRRVGDLTQLIGDSAAIQSVVSAFRDGRWRQQAA